MKEPFNLDFNTACTHSSMAYLIPHNTIAKARLHIRPGGFGEDGLFTQAPTGTVYLNCLFQIIEGPYEGRKIFHMLGLHSAIDHKGNNWAETGRAMIRAIVESARNVHPMDASDRARCGRCLTSFSELDNMVCVVRIGTQYDQTGQHGDRNIIKAVLTPQHEAYYDYVVEDQLPCSELPQFSLCSFDVLKDTIAQFYRPS